MNALFEKLKILETTKYTKHYEPLEKLSAENQARKITGILFWNDLLENEIENLIDIIKFYELENYLSHWHTVGEEYVSCLADIMLKSTQTIRAKYEIIHNFGDKIDWLSLENTTRHDNTYSSELVRQQTMWNKLNTSEILEKQDEPFASTTIMLKFLAMDYDEFYAGQYPQNQKRQKRGTLS